MSFELFAKFINQIFDHDFHQRIHKIASIEIYRTPLNNVPKLHHSFQAFYIAMVPYFPQNPYISNAHLDTGNIFLMEFRFFKNISC